MDECSDESFDFKSIQAFAYVCGCPDVQPSCTLCPAAVDPPSASKLTGDSERTTCGEYAEYVASLTVEQCIAQYDEIQSASSVCGCASPVAPPATVTVTTPAPDAVSFTPPPRVPDDDDDSFEMASQQMEKKGPNVVVICAVIVPVALAFL